MRRAKHRHHRTPPATGTMRIAHRRACATTMRAKFCSP